MKFKKILPQFLTLLFIVLVFGFFTMNAQVNMDNRGIEFGFGFLSQEASFDIQFSLIDYDGSKSYARAYLVGLLNTLLVSFIGFFINWLQIDSFRIYGIWICFAILILFDNKLIKKHILEKDVKGIAN